MNLLVSVGLATDWNTTSADAAVGRPATVAPTNGRGVTGIGVGAGSIPGSSQAAPGISVAAAIEHRARDEVGRGREVCDVEDRATPARWRRGRSIHFASRTAREACPTGHWMI